jgi:hypothetical protein
MCDEKRKKYCNFVIVIVIVITEFDFSFQQHLVTFSGLLIMISSEKISYLR